MARCYSPSSGGFESYGGRGIDVCPRWHTAANFVADMGKKPSRSHQIDRIDNTKGYEPGNCRWVTVSEQQRNKKGLRMLTINGKTQCATAWAEEAGINPAVVICRLLMGWDAAKAVFTPKMSRSQTLKRARSCRNPDVFPSARQ